MCFAQYKSGQAKELSLILKVDLQGSLQPIVDRLKKIGRKAKTESRFVSWRLMLVNISENDVNLASCFRRDCHRFRGQC